MEFFFGTRSSLAMGQKILARSAAWDNLFIAECRAGMKRPAKKAKPQMNTDEHR